MNYKSYLYYFNVWIRPIVFIFAIVILINIFILGIIIFIQSVLLPMSQVSHAPQMSTNLNPILEQLISSVYYKYNITTAKEFSIINIDPWNSPYKFEIIDLLNKLPITSLVYFVSHQTTVIKEEITYLYVHTGHEFYLHLYNCYDFLAKSYSEILYNKGANYLKEENLLGDIQTIFNRRFISNYNLLQNQIIENALNNYLYTVGFYKITTPEDLQYIQYYLDFNKQLYNTNEYYYYAKSY